MITKTTEFMRDFENDLNWININKSKPLIFKGSYTVKELGDILSDIDIQANVSYNSRLLSIVSNIIKKNNSNQSPFTFLQLIVGKYEEFIFPWYIYNDGKCYYNTEKTRIWYNNLIEKKILPKTLETYVYSKLFSNNIQISNLIEVENSLHLYANIIWTENDIIKGYKYVRGINYDLISIVKKEIPVLEYIYTYNNNFINIDFALIDYKYKIPISGRLNSYYTSDYYKIMKSYRWKIEKVYQTEYLQTMKTIETDISKIYLMNTFQNIINIQKINNNIKIKFISKKFKEILQKNNINEINIDKEKSDIDFNIKKKLKNSVFLYTNMLSSENKDKILPLLLRMQESELLIPQETIKNREEKYICPFFPIDLKYYNQIINFAKNFEFDSLKILLCFINIFETKTFSVDKILQEVIPKHRYTIEILDNIIFLKKENKTINKYNIHYLKKIQLLLLCTKT
jgi:hypothetical protein